MDKQEFVFKDPLVLANHIVFVTGNDSNVAIHKSLYFLFAFYGSVVYNDPQYPKYLFKEPFEAWRYGPVLRTVYLDSIEDLIKPKEWLPENETEDQIYDFIDMLLESLIKLDDFQLVDRSHEDQAWKDAYVDSPDQPIGIINSEQLILEYIRKEIFAESEIKG